MRNAKWKQRGLAAFLLFGLMSLFLVLPAEAQTAPIVITVTVTGTTGQATVNLVASPLAPISTMQFDVALPASGLVFVSVANGAILPAGKNASAQIVPGVTPDTIRILVFGLNQTAIPSGEVVKINFSGLPGAYPLPVSGIILSSPAGLQVPATGTPGRIVIP